MFFNRKPGYRSPQPNAIESAFSAITKLRISPIQKSNNRHCQPLQKAQPYCSIQTCSEPWSQTSDAQVCWLFPWCRYWLSIWTCPCTQLQGNCWRDTPDIKAGDCLNSRISCVKRRFAPNYSENPTGKEQSKAMSSKPVWKCFQRIFNLSLPTHLASCKCWCRWLSPFWAFWQWIDGFPASKYCSGWPLGLARWNRRGRNWGVWWNRRCSGKNCRSFRWFLFSRRWTPYSSSTHYRKGWNSPLMPAVPSRSRLPFKYSPFAGETGTRKVSITGFYTSNPSVHSQAPDSTWRLGWLAELYAGSAPGFLCF